MSHCMCLKNKYVLLRHAHSYPNYRGQIVSDPVLGRLASNGLTSTGLEQAREAACQLRNLFDSESRGKLSSTEANDERPRLIFISSDFSRALETAQTVLDILGSSSYELRQDERLRERFFGEYDLTEDTNYEKVWKNDSQNYQNGLSCNGVEPAVSVQQRTSELILELENSSKSCIYVLVSHGDSLQILQTWFEGIHPNQHRQMPHLRNCEIRLFDSLRR